MERDRRRGRRNIYVDEELWQRFKAQAHHERRSCSGLIDKFIRTWLEYSEERDRADRMTEPKKRR